MQARCTKSEARIAALLRILAGCAARGGRIPAVVFDRRATKHPAKIRAALRVGAAPAPRRGAGSVHKTPADSPRQRLASHPAALPTLLYEPQTWCTRSSLSSLTCSFSNDV